MIEKQTEQAAVAVAASNYEARETNAESVREQRLARLRARRWEQSAPLLKLAIELAEELRNRCDDPIHDAQLAELRAIEAEWAGMEPSVRVSDCAKKEEQNAE